MTVYLFMSLQSLQHKRNNFHSSNFWAWVEKNNRCTKRITLLDIKLTEYFLKKLKIEGATNLF